MGEQILETGCWNFVVGSIRVKKHRLWLAGAFDGNVIECPSGLSRNNDMDVIWKGTALGVDA